MRVYLCGPMSGIKLHNFPAFNEAAKQLRAIGYEVENPAELDNGDTTHPWAYYIKRDIPIMLTCDVVAVLPGWEQSKGANLAEVYLARLVGIPIYTAWNMQPIDDECILTKAARIVQGPRRKDYDHPWENFTRIAKKWSVTLGIDVTPEQVALCMIDTKVARMIHTPDHEDSIVDIAGYAKCLQLLKERRKELKEPKNE